MYSRGVQSKDSRLATRHIYSELLTARSEILRQKSNKGQLISRWAYQTIPCIDLIKAKPYECQGLPINIAGDVLRTKYKLPSIVTDSSRPLITFITTLDGLTRFDYITFEANKYSPGNKYTAVKPNFLIKNGYGFITHRLELKGVMLEAIFDDPLEAYLFPSSCTACGDCACKDMQDYNFPIDRALLKATTQLANNNLILLFKQMTQDKTNNASDDTSVAGGQMIHPPSQQIQE